MEKINRLIQQILIGLIRGYRYILSPWIGYRCRFVPSCSQFAEDALQQHHWLKACFLTLGRLLRCHPLCPGGYDPVPANKKRTSS